jgi:hypothetical protein
MAARPHAESDTDAIRAVARKLVDLDEKDTASLVELYEQLRGEKPRSWHRSHLLKVLAYDVQEQAFGGLSRRARRRIRELGAQAPPAWRDRVARAGMGSAPTAVASATQQPPPAAPALSVSQTIDTADPRTSGTQGNRDARLPPSGTVIVRVYKRREHRVLVRDDSFEYDGQVFTSISAVAREITGKQVNGFYFFQLVAAHAT